MARLLPSSSSSHNWVYDIVFPSFSGEDVRVTFLSHFLKELDRKLISVFKDYEIERGHPIGPELKWAIRDSRIAVVVFSKNYASSSWWCLDELVEIMKCKEDLSQTVIPIFYGLDPSDVRKQTGEFGKMFENTCQAKTDDEIQLCRKALTDVANIVGYHSRNWDNEARMIEEITNDVLRKLNLSPSKGFEEFSGIEDHIAHMSLLLRLELEEVRMVGIWGPSGIGKTIIARALYSRLYRHFQGSVFIDKAFVSKSMEIFNRANPDDYNMKLHLQESFLSKVLGKDIKIEHLGAVEERLKYQKVIIFIDDLDDQVVLDTLAGQTKWFGSGSRIIVITKDKHLLRAHGIDCIYEVGLPHENIALEMFCQSAFKQNSPPDGFIKLASEVVERAGSLPLGLNVLGSYLRGKEKEDWIYMLPRLQKALDGKIENTLIVSYDGLDNEDDKSIFRHIACFFNHTKVNDIKLLLGESDLDVNIGLKTLNDKSLVHIRWNTVEMHHLLQEMGKKIVRKQSDEPGKREFLVDSDDICDVLYDSTGTKKVLGIALDIDEIDELHINEKAFEGMCNLRFLKIYTTDQWTSRKEVKLYLPKDFNYLPPKLRLLNWYKYPVRFMPSNFHPENLVKLKMPESKLEKLWEGVRMLASLKNIDLSRSKNLKEIPNLSMATNLETLDLNCCSSLVELPSSIRNLNKLTKLNMSRCYNLKSLPTGFNLKSLDRLDLNGCSRLRNFPDFSNNMSDLFLDQTAIEELPSNLRLNNLVDLSMREIKNKKLWEGVKVCSSSKS